MDSKFLHRLKYYGFGFGIGSIFVFFFFQNRGCSWLPGNRVKNSILDRVIVVSDLEMAFMKSKGIGKEEIMSALNDGDIDFGASKKKGELQVYLIEKEFDKIGMQKLYFTLPRESFISEVKMAEPSAQKVYNSTTGFGRFIHFPKDDYLMYPDTTRRVNCQLESINALDAKVLLKKVKATGFLDFAKTDFNVRPKAEQYISFIVNNDTIGAKGFWYQNKINVSSFYTPKNQQCDSLFLLK